jgi:hypothetical protein
VSKSVQVPRETGERAKAAFGSHNQAVVKIRAHEGAARIAGTALQIVTGCKTIIVGRTSAIKSRSWGWICGRAEAQSPNLDVGTNTVTPSGTNCR